MVRIKNRYLVIEVIHPHRQMGKSLGIKTTPLHISIMKNMQEIHGDFGVAATTLGFEAKYCNDKSNIAVIKSRHGPHRLIASSLPLVKSIDNKHVTINTLYIGATIKNCFKFVQKYQQRKYDEYCAGITSDLEREELRRAFLDIDGVAKMI